MSIDHDDTDAGADALDWAIRTADPAFDDWEGFTLWLEADPARSERYDAIVATLAMAEHALAPIAATAALASPTSLLPARRGGGWRPVRLWLGGAIAATLAGTVGFGLWTHRAQPYVVETAAGAPRAIDLGDGSDMVMAGGTRVRLDHADPRVARLEAGDALFRIRHDADHPFRVTVSDTVLTDIGTLFDVGRHGAEVRVAVADGAVMVDPDGAAVRLDRGQAARIANGRIVRATMDPADIGSWREGRLAYDDTPLDEVANDLSRHLGIHVVAVPAIAHRRFGGTLDANRLRADPALLGALLDVRVRADATGWTLEPPE